jgi:hypothetical protein
MKSSLLVFFFMLYILMTSVRDFWVCQVCEDTVVYSSRSCHFSFDTEVCDPFQLCVVLDFFSDSCYSICWKVLAFPTELLWYLCGKINCSYIYGLFQDCVFVPLICLSWCQCHTISNYFCFIISLEIGSMRLPSLFLIKIVWLCRSFAFF